MGARNGAAVQGREGAALPGPHPPKAEGPLETPISIGGAGGGRRACPLALPPITSRVPGASSPGRRGGPWRGGRRRQRLPRQQPPPPAPPAPPRASSAAARHARRRSRSAGGRSWTAACGGSRRGIRAAPGHAPPPAAQASRAESVITISVRCRISGTAERCATTAPSRRGFLPVSASAASSAPSREPFGECSRCGNSMKRSSVSTPDGERMARAHQRQEALGQQADARVDRRRLGQHADGDSASPRSSSACQLVRSAWRMASRQPGASCPCVRAAAAPARPRRIRTARR
jgi:hypothetical protein